MQALAIYSYDQDAMAVSGQIFFPILFTLMALYLMMRNPGGSAMQLVAVLGEVAVLMVTVVGSSQKIAALYPSIIVYYAALGVLVFEVAVRIARMPKKTKKTAFEGAAADSTDSHTEGTGTESTNGAGDSTKPDEPTPNTTAPRTPRLRGGLNRKAPVRRGQRLVARKTTGGGNNTQNRHNKDDSGTSNNTGTAS